jgi:hypothetical protein
MSRATAVDLFTTDEPIIVKSMEIENIGIDNSYNNIIAVRQSESIETLG